MPNPPSLTGGRAPAFRTLAAGLALVLLAIGQVGCALFRAAEKPGRPQMTFVPGGTFVMGDIYGDQNTDALPAHTVTLEDFRIGTYEVTYGQYDIFARATGRPLPPDDALGRGDRAVVYVNWEEAVAFCAWHGMRLPSEEEWEYAARGGGRKSRFSGTSEADSLERYARVQSNSAPNSFPGGSKKPNRLGLFDMSGNVLEWVGDYYQYYPEEGEPPRWDDLEQRTLRVLRGGSFKEPGHIAATYWRIGMLMETREYDVGFRCAAGARYRNR